MKLNAVTIAGSQDSRLQQQRVFRATMVQEFNRNLNIEYFDRSMPRRPDCSIDANKRRANLNVRACVHGVCVVCACVCHNEKKVPDEWQARQATPAILQVSSSKHNAKKITTSVRGPFHQSITAILTEEKREAVY